MILLRRETLRRQRRDRGTGKTGYKWEKGEHRQNRKTVGNGETGEGVCRFVRP